LVRHVSEGTDIGIDLYCESLIGETPYKHFWVQVKALGPNSFEYGKGARYRFNRKHLEYWSNQPVPVYAFLVPVVGRPPKAPEYIFGIRLTHIFVRDGLPDSSTVTYTSTEGFAADSVDDDLQGFIRYIVPWDTAALGIPRGVIAPIDEPEEPTPGSFPKNLTLRHVDNIISTMRFATEMLLGDLVEARDSPSDLMAKRRIVAEVASALESQLHVIGLTGLGASRLLDGNREETHRLFSLARDMIHDTVKDQEERERQIKEIDEFMKKIL
jgi:hypothetical protein